MQNSCVFYNFSNCLNTIFSVKQFDRLQQHSTVIVWSHSDVLVFFWCDKTMNVHTTCLNNFCVRKLFWSWYHQFCWWRSKQHQIIIKCMTMHNVYFFLAHFIKSLTRHTMLNISMKCIQAMYVYMPNFNDENKPKQNATDLILIRPNTDMIMIQMLTIICWTLIVKANKISMLEHWHWKHIDNCFAYWYDNRTQMLTNI